MLNRNIISLASATQQIEDVWSPAQQQILDVLQSVENPQIPLKELYRKAHVSKHAWYKAIQDQQFVATVEALGHPCQTKKSF